LDAVALPRKFGKPDLFITMTANPYWPEIIQALPARSHWSHHQDIVDRVFYMKLKAMLDMIVKKRLFGEVQYSLWITIKFLIRFRFSPTYIELSGKLAACLTLIVCSFCATKFCHQGT